jgi:hypothetical protein
VAADMLKKFQELLYSLWSSNQWYRVNIFYIPIVEKKQLLMFYCSYTGQTYEHSNELRFK